MQLSMKCSVAVHCLIFIHETENSVKVTSTLLSQSTGVNPVVIRNILSALKKLASLQWRGELAGPSYAESLLKLHCIIFIVLWNRTGCRPLSESTNAPNGHVLWPRIFRKCCNPLIIRQRILSGRPWKVSRWSPCWETSAARQPNQNKSLKVGTVYRHRRKSCENNMDPGLEFFVQIRIDTGET